MKERTTLKQFLNQIIEKLELNKNSVKKKELEKAYDAQSHTHKKRALHEKEMFFLK